ncbi:MAG TPA: hypothetical protein VGE97_00320, partial [Nitrososphaera sp.]
VNVYLQGFCSMVPSAISDLNDDAFDCSNFLSSGRVPPTVQPPVINGNILYLGGLSIVYKRLIKSQM